MSILIGYISKINFTFLPNLLFCEFCVVLFAKTPIMADDELVSFLCFSHIHTEFRILI